MAQGVPIHTITETESPSSPGTPSAEAVWPVEVLFRLYTYFPPGTVFTTFRVVCRKWHDAAVAHLSLPRHVVTLRASKVRAFWAAHPTRGSWTECLMAMRLAGVRFNLPVALPEKCTAATLEKLLADPVATQINQVVVAWRTKRLPFAFQLPSGFTGFPAAIAGRVLQAFGLRRRGVSLVVGLAINKELMAEVTGVEMDPAASYEEGQQAPDGCLDNNGPAVHPRKRRRAQEPRSLTYRTTFWESIASLHISFWCPINVHRNPYPSVNYSQLQPLMGLLSLTITIVCDIDGLLPLCPRLETLTVSRNHQLRNLDVLSNKAICPALQSVSISHCGGFASVDGLKDRPKLWRIELESCKPMRLASLLTLPKLTALVVCNCIVLDEPVVHLVPSLQHLKWIRNFVREKVLHQDMGLALLRHPRLQEVTTTFQELVSWIEAGVEHEFAMQGQQYPLLRLIRPPLMTAQLLHSLPAGLRSRLLPTHVWVHRSDGTLFEHDVCPIGTSLESYALTRPICALSASLTTYLWVPFIRELTLSQCHVDDCRHLRWFVSLTALELRPLVLAGEPAAPADWLATMDETLRKLHRLQLYDQHLINIGPLGECKKLRFLSLAWCTSVANLAPLRNCPQLQSLILRRMPKLCTIEPLAGCPALRALRLTATNVVDLSPLTTCASLRFLTVDNLDASQLPVLSRMSALEWLKVYGTGIARADWSRWLRSSNRPPALLHAQRIPIWRFDRSLEHGSLYFVDAD